MSSIGTIACRDETARVLAIRRVKGRARTTQAPIRRAGLHGQGQAMGRQSSSWRPPSRAQTLLGAPDLSSSSTVCPLIAALDYIGCRSEAETVKTSRFLHVKLT